MILFRQKYPRWWFDWNLELQRFINRVWTYLVLVNDNYPSTDDHQWVRLDYPYPDAATDLNRWLPLVKWLLAIPYYIVLFFLDIVLFFVVIAAWFAILFTGRYPRGMFSFVEGVFRWHNRVVGYALTLGLAPQTGRGQVRHEQAAQARPPAGGPEHRPPCRSPGAGKPGVGTPPDPWRTDETRCNCRAVRHLGDPARFRHRTILFSSGTGADQPPQRRAGRGLWHGHQRGGARFRAGLGRACPGAFLEPLPAARQSLTWRSTSLRSGWTTATEPCRPTWLNSSQDSSPPTAGATRWSCTRLRRWASRPRWWRRDEGDTDLTAGQRWPPS